MSAPPRRPPGPPPARPPPGDSQAGSIGTGPPMKRPPGPPPGAAPIATIKPPPNAPPDLSAQTQRPPVEGIKRPAPDGPPPDISEPKKAVINPPPSQAKAGGISMFEEPIEKAPLQQQNPPRPNIPRPAGPPAQNGFESSMPGSRAPRPLPPRANPPGIPEGQPLPPTQAKVDIKRAPPPTRPPPKTEEGGRAPPVDDPEEERRRLRTIVQPPTTEPPLLRVKKAPEVPVLKRREKDMPEMEESDDEEEVPNLIKQPLPFGVLKEKIPEIKTGPKEEIIEPDNSAAQAVDMSSVSEQTKQTKDDASTVTRKKREKPQESVVPPPVAPTESKANEFVPSAPKEGLIEKHFDDSSIGKDLSRGRLSIKCIEGIDIRRKDDQDRVPRNDPFIKFRLGAAERHPWKSTAPKRKQNANPKFDDEIVYFDVVDPIQFIFNDDIQLYIELWNKSTARNEMVGSVSMSVVRFFKQPFVSFTEKVPIYYPGATRTPMKLKLELVFEEARSGLAQVTLFEASGLRNIDPMGQQDPYVQLSLGKRYKKRIPSVKAGGTDPFFNESEILMWLDQENWIEDLLVEVLDEDAKEEKPIGITHFSMLPYMKITPDSSKVDTFDLFYYVLIDPKDDSEKKEVPSGQITLRVRFLPAGKLTVFIDRANGLQLPETVSTEERIDPYVQLTLDGQAVQTVKRTPADKDGGKNPVWRNEIFFDVVDQYSMDLKVFNQSAAGSDVLIGFAEISLLAVFRNGSMEFWTSLKQKRSNGGVKEVGDIFIKLGFVGPVGVAYPQLRPDVDSFDDALRKFPTIGSDAAAIRQKQDQIKPEISTLPDDQITAEAMQKVKEYGDRTLGDKIEQEFTDEEILAAFRFIDLDHNNFVGAGEIRHILVCMGEMITDEEIDMMISMVDGDGDGQVSFKEFRALVLHPNPGLVDMHKEFAKEKDIELMKDKQAATGKAQGLDLATFQRQKEMMAREQKKKMIINFIEDNEIDFVYIREAHQNFLELPKEKRVNGRVHFPEFCVVMKVEGIQAYKNLHAFYDDEELGDMDIREFLLSMMNFVPVDKEERLKFSFEMFDEQKTGFIAQREVEEILRGNHILPLLSVKKKAETVMKQALTNDSGSLTLKEFLVVSKKFPNILFPTAGILTAKVQTALKAAGQEV